MISTIKKIFLLIIFVFLLLNTFFSTGLSTDCWWHLSSGKKIIQNRGLPSTDDFYCAGGNRWYSHEWLFDVLAFVIYKKFGITGLKIICSVVFLLTIIFIFLNSYFISKKNLTVSFFVSFISSIFLIPFLEERPQVFTMLFFSIFAFVTNFKFSKKLLIYYFLLIPLLLLWVNIQYTILAGIYIFILNSVFYIKECENKKEQIIIYSTLFIFFIMVAILNPEGFKAFVFFEKDMGIKSYIKEWQGIFSAGGVKFFIYQILYIISGLLFLLFFILKFKENKKEMALRILLIIAPFLVAPVFFKRAIMFFAILFPYILYLTDQIKIKIKRLYLIYLLLFLIFIVIIGIKMNVQYPYRIIEYIKNNVKNECVLTSFEIGGFAEYFIYPENKVFLNGRLNVPFEIWMEYSQIYYAEGDFNEIIKKYGIRYFLIPNFSPIFKYFILNKTKPIFMENNYGLFFIK